MGRRMLLKRSQSGLTCPSICRDLQVLHLQGHMGYTSAAGFMASFKQLRSLGESAPLRVLSLTRGMRVRRHMCVAHQISRRTHSQPGRLQP